MLTLTVMVLTVAGPTRRGTTLAILRGGAGEH